MYIVAQKIIHYLSAVTFQKIQMPKLNIGGLAVLGRISKHFMSSLILINVLGQTQQPDLHIPSSKTKLHCYKDVVHSYTQTSPVLGGNIQDSKNKVIGVEET